MAPAVAAAARFAGLAVPKRWRGRAPQPGTDPSGGHASCEATTSVRDGLPHVIGHEKLDDGHREGQQEQADEDMLDAVREGVT